MRLGLSFEVYISEVFTRAKKDFTNLRVKIGNHFIYSKLIYIINFFERSFLETSFFWKKEELYKWVSNKCNGSQFWPFNWWNLFFHAGKTSGHIPQKIAQVSFYRLHKKSQRSLFLYSFFNHFSKFRIFEDFFLTPIKESERSRIAKRVLFGWPFTPTGRN